MIRTIALVLTVLVPSAAAAKASDPVTRFCGPEPKTDVAAMGPVKVAERLLARVLETRGKVFKAYRTEYFEDRKVILARNKRLPKSQHLPVPPARTDEDLKKMKVYNKRIKKAHASLEDETAARKKLDGELAKLQGTNAVYRKCRSRILDRIRTASSKRAAVLLKIPAKKRLLEEIRRLGHLKSQYLQMLEVNRKDPKVMVPIVSASICAHKSMGRDLSGEIRAIKRQAKITKRNSEEDVAALDERREELSLEIIELRRDLKIFGGRQARCGRKQAALSTCIKADRKSPGSKPPSCASFAMELQLLGYSERRWK